ncbi:hypothetical protein C0J52_20898 [Blattella germanica]|nr:hypothetical protein C0J52_20898 [Blattella germanica]
MKPKGALAPVANSMEYFLRELPYLHDKIYSEENLNFAEQKKFLVYPSDGRDNILGALVIAANYIIPEVTVFFRNSLFRGNRTMKMSTDALHAFNSPNMAPLATIGINIEVDYKSIFRPDTIEKFNVHSYLNPNVSLLRLFPNITIQAVKAYLQPPTEGIVLQTYGAGNIPSNRDDITQALKSATDRGVLIVNCTQCIEGSVSAVYETGMVLSEAGVIPGSDMTPEAALTKLSYVLSKTEWDIETKRKMMQKNIRGELTSEEKEVKGKMLKDILQVQDEPRLEQIMVPAFAVAKGELKRLKSFHLAGATLSEPDFCDNTALHIVSKKFGIFIMSFLPAVLYE